MNEMGVGSRRSAGGRIEDSMLPKEREDATILPDFGFAVDPRLIAEYKRYHERVWPEITKSIRDAGIAEMEIYLWGRGCS